MIIMSAINFLRALDDVNILCVPDAANRSDWLDIQKHMVEHCEQLRDRFAILDALRGKDGQTQLDQFGSERGYAALYYPWIVISNPSGNAPLKIPPSGHVAGVYAYTDSTRGVHKAPANQAIKGALDLEKALTDDEQGPLNEKGINVLRNFSGRGQVVWGARTIAPAEATQWRYINVRRLLIYIEASLQRATRFAVFEPNNLALWQTVKRQVTAFLTEVWRSGALFGATQDDAFRVRIDEELNPPDQRDQGILVIEVKVAPVKPAEFIEFQIIQTSSISGLQQ